jgi:hypothetical protein
MRLELFRHSVVMRIRWKLKGQSTIYAFQKTALWGHEDTDVVTGGRRTVC